MEFYSNSKASTKLVYNEQTKFEIVENLIKEAQRIKSEIRKLPIEVQNEIEAAIDANIIYNSEAIEEDTLPKEKAIPLLMKNARRRNGELFKS